jgi:gamma-glutamylputrescine oxidase
MNYPNPVQAGEHVNSYYASSANQAFSRPPLQTQIDADVCVIGAGFSGLSSALHLAELGYQLIQIVISAGCWIGVVGISIP